MLEWAFGNKQDGEVRRSNPSIREKLHYEGEIDAGVFMQALKEHNLKGVSFDSREHTITYYRDQREKIQKVLSDLGIDMDEERGTIH